MAYYGYMRVSTETQAEHGYGLDAQREAIDKYAAQQGITIDDYFTDAGKSGAAKDTATDDEAISKRAALLELLSTINEGDSVIVLNTSRLWRSDVTKVIIRREFMKRGAKIVSVEQPRYDLYASDPNDRLIAGMLELLDEWDRASIALKLARGRNVKAKGGDKPAGVCPYGYKYTEDKKHVVINPDEAQHVKLMFTRGQQGRTLSEITDELNAAGITTRRGGAWTRGSVQAILRNRFYLGELQHQGKTVQGTHEALVSKIQFGKVAAALDRRHK